MGNGMIKDKTNVTVNETVNDCLVKNFSTGIWNFDFDFLIL